jgi:hypothetical protein
VTGPGQRCSKCGWQHPAYQTCIYPQRWRASVDQIARREGAIETESSEPLVTKPEAPVTKPEQSVTKLAPTVTKGETVTKRVGRPRTYDAARPSTPAERAAAYRQRKKERP